MSTQVNKFVVISTIEYEYLKEIAQNLAKTQSNTETGSIPVVHLPPSPTVETASAPTNGAEQNVLITHENCQSQKDLKKNAVETETEENQKGNRPEEHVLIARENLQFQKQPKKNAMEFPGKYRHIAAQVLRELRLIPGFHVDTVQDTLKIDNDNSLVFGLYDIIASFIHSHISLSENAIIALSQNLSSSKFPKRLVLNTALKKRLFPRLKHGWRSYKNNGKKV